MLPLLFTTGLLAEAPSPAPPPPKPLRVCVGEDDWFPFSFKKDGAVKGVHVDLVREAAAKAGFKAEFTTMPWARCVNLEAKRGSMDAALSAGWRKDRAEYLDYPAGAETEGPACQSKQSIMCNGHVLAVPKESPYVFDGDLAKVPPPIRIVHGYTQIQEYEARGVKVDTGPTDVANVRKMIRDGSGSVLILLQTARRLDKIPELRGRFRIIDDFKDMGDSFLPFAKKASLSKAEKEAVWSELGKLSQDPERLEAALRIYGAE